MLPLLVRNVGAGEHAMATPGREEGEPQGCWCILGRTVETKGVMARDNDEEEHPWKSSSEKREKG